MEDRFLRHWTLAFVAGELIGFVPPAIVGTWLGTSGAGDGALVLGLTVAGALEGASIGSAQAWALTRHRSRVPAVPWITATAAGAALAWLAGMGGAALAAEASSPSVFWLLVPVWLLGLAGMGVLQWLVLRTRAPRSARWVAVSSGAWLLGVLIPVAAISLTPSQWPVAAQVGVAVASAVVMGLVVGLLTGRTMRALLTRSAG